MKKYGLIGFPLEQSFSQKHFSKKFNEENIDAEYLNFELESIGEFLEIIEDNEDLKGLNVTIPYKVKVMPFIDELDKEAEKIGAINTIRISEKDGDPYLTGYNTDVFGFEETLKPFLEAHHTKALILGTGGASKAVKFVLNKLGIDFKIVSRNPKTNCFIYDDISEDILTEYKLVINSTPLGMYPNIEDSPKLPYQSITPKHLFYDLIYNPAETKFLTKARKRGATTVNGQEMLVKQAEKAWEIWSK